MIHKLRERADWIERHILLHEPSLRRYLASLRLPQGLEIDDIVQESYARLSEVKNVNDIRNAKFYFYQVARSIIFAHVRRAKIVSIITVENIEQFNFLVDEMTPETRASDREQLARLLNNIASLPKPSRDAFILRTIHGLSHREIGKRLGMSDNSVQKNIAKNLRYLMKNLEEGGNETLGASNLETVTGESQQE